MLKTKQKNNSHHCCLYDMPDTHYAEYITLHLRLNHTIQIIDILRQSNLLELGKIYPRESHHTQDVTFQK